jgi:hypothetical protein
LIHPNSKEIIMKSSIDDLVAMGDMESLDEIMAGDEE